MPNLYKIFSKIILKRLTSQLDDQQPIEQAGFRTGYSTADHMHVVKQLIEKCQEYNKTVYLAFVDYTKAFDSLEHNYIWKALKNQRIPNKYIRILRNIYQNCTAQIKLEIIGEAFPICKGVRQGDPLSAKIFSTVLEEIFRSIDWLKYGIKINGTLLTHLRFADDLVLIADNSTALQKMLQELSDNSKPGGLAINKTKTKVMSNGNTETIVVDGEHIEYVNSYVYLGQLISFTKQMDQEIERRVTYAWRKYWSFKEIMKNCQYPMSIKRKLFNICILPTLTYGCQTWALTQKNLARIRTCQRSMERSMLGIIRTDRKKCKDIREITKLCDAVAQTRKQKWRWTGHMIRERNRKWTKQITEWDVWDGSKRKRGRQRKRWVDDIKQTAGNLWWRKAQDREIWKNLEEAYASEDALIVKKT